jgi:cytochrome c
MAVPAVAVLLAAGQANAAMEKDAALELAKKSGCLACHSIEKKVVGPAWQDVANKYKGDASMKDKLVAKVKAGGKGVWGEVPMPPYSPRVADADITSLVEFVLSLAK